MRDKTSLSVLGMGKVRVKTSRKTVKVDGFVVDLVRIKLSNGVEYVGSEGASAQKAVFDCMSKVAGKIRRT